MATRKRAATTGEVSPVVHCIKEQTKDKVTTKCGSLIKPGEKTTIWWSDVTCLDCRPFGWQEMLLWKGGPKMGVMVDRRTGKRQEPPPLRPKSAWF